MLVLIKIHMYGAVCNQLADGGTALRWKIQICYVYFSLIRSEFLCGQCKS